MYHVSTTVIGGKQMACEVPAAGGAIRQRSARARAACRPIAAAHPAPAGAAHPKKNIKNQGGKINA
jgi:hypothetical protein